MEAAKLCNEFLWINKTPKSISLSNNKDDASQSRRINEYLQKRKRLLALARLRSQSTTSTEQYVFDTNTPFNQRSRTPDVSRFGSCIDPFSSSVVPITNEVLDMLHNFTESYMAKNLQAEVQTVFCPYKNPASKHIACVRILRGCFAQERRMYSVLAMIACRFRDIYGHQPTEHQHTPEYFKDKALRSLRAEFGREDTNMQEDMVLDILFMATAESYSGNVDGALTHYKMITHLVENLGGFGAIDKYTRRICRLTELYSAAKTLTPSLWDLDEDTSAFTEDLGCSAKTRTSDPSVNVVSFPETFEVFDEDMALAIRDVVGLARVAQSVWDCQGIEVMTMDRNRIMERCNHLIHKLLGMKASSVMLQTNSLESAIQECCRRSLLLWLLHVLGGTSGTTLKSSSIRNRSIMRLHSKCLRSIIEQVDQVNVHSTRGGPYNGLLFWILGLGTLVAEDNSEDDTWFRENFSHDAKRRGICTYDTYASAVIAYLPLDRLELVKDHKLARTLILNTEQPQPPSVD